MQPRNIWRVKSLAGRAHLGQTQFCWLVDVKEVAGRDRHGPQFTGWAEYGQGSPWAIPGWSFASQWCYHGLLNIFTLSIIQNLQVELLRKRWWLRSIIGCLYDHFERQKRRLYSLEVQTGIRIMVLKSVVANCAFLPKDTNKADCVLNFVDFLPDWNGLKWFSRNNISTTNKVKGIP